MLYWMLIIGALGGGLVQAISGFGCGIVFMAIMPYFLPLIESAGISNFMAIFLSGSMSWQYRHSIRWQWIPIPFVIFEAFSFMAMVLAPQLDVWLMKGIFGIFLILLALYFSLFAHRVSLQPTIPTMLLCGGISGLCDGLFGIGGPLMVLYFLSLSKSKEEYLGTIQAFFTMTVTTNFLFRLYRHLFPLEYIPMALLAVVFVVIGMLVGSKIAHKINDALMKKIIYLMIGISGVSTLISLF